MTGTEDTSQDQGNQEQERPGRVPTRPSRYEDLRKDRGGKGTPGYETKDRPRQDDGRGAP